MIKWIIRWWNNKKLQKRLRVCQQIADWYTTYRQNQIDIEAAEKRQWLENILLDMELNSGQSDNKLFKESIFTEDDIKNSTYKISDFVFTVREEDGKIVKHVRKKYGDSK